MGVYGCFMVLYIVYELDVFFAVEGAESIKPVLFCGLSPCCLASYECSVYNNDNFVIVCVYC